MAANLITASKDYENQYLIHQCIHSYVHITNSHLVIWSHYKINESAKYTCIIQTQSNFDNLFDLNPK